MGKSFDQNDGRVRYLVVWTPWADVKSAARKAGWVEVYEGGLAANDFVDVFDFERRETFRAFSDAVAFARAVADDDTWQCPRIHRETLNVHDTDDLGRKVEASLSWDREAMWEVFAGGDDPVEDKPDLLDEAA